MDVEVGEKRKWRNKMTAGRKNNSQTKDWNTPPEIVTAVLGVLGQVDLDPCSNGYSLIPAETHFDGISKCGLKELWNYQNIYVNPPYGRNLENKTTIATWLHKCSEANKSFGSSVIALIPVATNTRHWQQNIFVNAKGICFLKASRLKFYKDGKPVPKGAPMSCAVVYWGNDFCKFENVFSDLGKVVEL
jgi:hypothetical protein